MRYLFLNSILILVLLISSASVYAGDYTIDGCRTQAGAGQWGLTAGPHAVNFTPSVSGLLHKVELYLNNNTAPGDTLDIFITSKNDSTVFPNETDILSSVETISIDGQQWYNTSLATPANIVAGTTYHLVLNETSPGPLWGQGDVSVCGTGITQRFNVGPWATVTETGMFVLYINATNVSDCMGLDTANEIYYMDINLTGKTTSDCLDITANNVTLDCQNFLLDGNDVADTGIQVSRGTQENVNVTIQNCLLSDWDTNAIDVSKADNVTIDNVSTTSLPREGLLFTNSDDSIINNSHINSGDGGVTDDGISLILSDRYIVQNTEVNATGQGMVDASCVGAKSIIDSNFTSGSLIFDLAQVTGTGCFMTFSNVLGIDDLPVVFFNTTQTISNWNNNFSQMIFCNADLSTINNITMRENSRRGGGIQLTGSSDSVNITNSSFSGIYSILIRSSDSLLFDNNLVNFTDSNSINILSSTSTKITNSNFTDSDLASITLSNAADSSNITGNRFTGDQTFIDAVVSTANSNTIYNNFFNSTGFNNFIDSVATDNFFNITTRLGARVFSNGTNIGGNYYANSSGTGPSETCTDADRDGFCDTNFTGGGEAVDFLPMSNTFGLLTINKPSDGLNILNNLSTVLNTTSLGFNNATWYTWNKGIINTTLCQPPGPCVDNETQITFPRRGLFNLTVYANDSSGTITSDTATNVFVGNFTQVFFDSFQNHNNWTDDANNDWDTTDCSPAGCAHGDNFNPSLINLTTAVDLSSYSESDNVNVSFQYKEGSGTLESDDCVNYHLWGGSSWTNDIEIFCDDIGTTYLNNTITLNSTHLVSGFKFRFEGEAFTGTSEDVFIDNFNISSLTLNLANTPPNVTAVTTNRTNFTSTSANLTFNVTDDNDYLLNASLYINSSYNSSVLTNIARNISLNFTKTFVSGTYTWFVRAYDTDLRFNDSDIFTFKINSPPTLISVELNKTSGVVATDDLNCTAVGINDVDQEQTPRLEFEWYNNSVAEGINDSRLDSGNLTNNEEWYCEAWATDGFLNSSRFTSSTVNVSSSKTSPTLTRGNATTALTNVNSTVANPTNNNSWINFTWNFTDPNTDKWTGYVCDTPNFGVCSANASGEILCKSSDNITSKNMSCRINASGYSGDNPETVYAFVQDNESLVSSSRSTTFEINHPPSVPTIISPVNNSFISVGYTIINYTATDSNSDVINFTIYNSTDDVTYFIANSSNLTFFNWTDLSDGTYYTRAFSTDEHSYSFNTNSSTSQFTVDTVTPTLSIISPIDTTIYRSTTLSLIISATDTNLASCNYTLIFADVGSVSSSGSANCTGGTAVSTPFYSPGYNITISVNDSAGNVNTTTINFFAIALSGGGGGGGGGGDAQPTIDIAEEIKKEIEEAVICGNGVCQATEGPLTCPGDCPPDLGAIFCPITGGTDCPAWVFSYMLYGLGIYAAVFTIRRQKRGR